MISDCLKGKENYDEEEHRGKKKRMPVTFTVMKLLKALLRKDKSRTKLHKALIWAVACVSFNGCLRVGEILSKAARKFDPLNCLLKKDIWVTHIRVKGVKKEVLNIKLKSDKASRAATRGMIIEVFANGTELCPLRAYRAYMESCPMASLSSAAFRSPEGWCYRHQRFKDDLKSLLITGGGGSELPMLQEGSGGM